MNIVFLMAASLLVQPVAYAQENRGTDTVVSAHEDSGVRAMVDLLGPSRFQLPLTMGAEPPPGPTIADTLVNDLRNSVAWAVKSCTDFEKGLVSDFNAAKNIVRDHPELQTQVCDDFKLTVSVTTVVDAPWLGEVAYDATLKALPIVTDFTTEMFDTFHDTFIGRDATAYREIKGWYDKQVEPLDRATSKVKGWVQDLQRTYGTTQRIVRDRAVTCIDDDGQLNICWQPPSPQEQLAEDLKKLPKSEQKEMTEDQKLKKAHEWMGNQFRKTKSEDEAKKAKSRDLQSQGAAAGRCGFGGGGYRNPCP